MLNQPHSAVNQLNYGSIGSHTLQDAGLNAQNHISKHRRIQNMKMVQQNNRNSVGLPKTNKQFGNLGASSSVYLDTGMSMSAFLGGIALMGLTKTYDKRQKIGTGAQALAALGTLAGAYQYYSKDDATVLITGLAGIAGLTVGANLFKVGLKKGFLGKIANDFRRLSL